MKNFRLFLLWVSSLLIFSNCTTQKQTENIDYTVIDSGAYGGLSTPGHKLVNNKAEYDLEFKELKKNVFPVEYPEYSPEKSYIFISFGEKSSGGLDYKVKQVSYTAEKTTVFLESIHANQNPSVPMMGTQAIANPYIVLEINKIKTNKLDIVTE